MIALVSLVVLRHLPLHHTAFSGYGNSVKFCMCCFSSHLLQLLLLLHRGIVGIESGCGTALDGAKGVLPCVGASISLHVGRCRLCVGTCLHVIAGLIA